MGHLSFSDKEKIVSTHNRRNKRRCLKVQGVIFALMSGLFIALQGIFNARLGDAIGPWFSVTIVHFVGLMGCLAIYSVVRDRKIGGFRQLPLLYASGGLLGVLVVVTELTSIQLLGMTWAMCLLLVAQILCAFVIDLNGWFGVIKKRSNRGQWIGISLMLAGVAIFSLS
nr:DMT family transporter [Exiguobacterium sp. s127]